MITHYANPELAGIILTFEHRRSVGDPVRILLAEGDSWFSFGGATSNLLMALDNKDTLIVSCATPGDSIRKMSSIGNNPFHMMLSPSFGVEWDAVLLSAGGNDLLADIRQIISGGNIDKESMTIALDGVTRGYKHMIEEIRWRHPKCPIHAHTYDYPITDVVGGLFRLGPWIGTQLVQGGVADHRHDAIVRHVLDALADRLNDMPGLIVHDTRGTLPPGKWRPIGWQKYWRNEIHPSTAGYALLAAKWKL